ncbi:zinc dependent phospholipase C family protein [Desulfovibrio mangrovi]|uniref:zinc dependent phospholipase C family protein n=1 Tax=Desulfovibrio mangrovi TaxID=2976983 RepID=UPI0022481546|nr:zinc dependent phospholipase C family protein [Desulfovibrio mangrovi]UZP66402.1 zinc dependent phospholipase C family protein [Desulfovibrio mangrovi]
MTYCFRTAGRIASLAFVAFVLLALLPDHAHAWGPGVHIATANWVFANAALLPALAARHILAHKDAFMYGCLSADIFIGKGCSVKPGHSHNWETGLKLLDSVRGPRLKSYALGYLSHLAADIVAHNNYVPAMMSTTPGSGKLSHVYIEAQADRLVRWDARNALRLFGSKHAVDADSSLCSATSAGKMPFKFKKHVFKGSMALCGAAPWRSSLSVCSLVTPETQNPAELDRMLNASLRAVVNVLNDPFNSPLTTLDPIGEQPLKDAKALCRGRTPLAFRNPFPLQFPLHGLVTALPDLPQKSNRTYCSVRLSPLLADAV